MGNQNSYEQHGGNKEVFGKSTNRQIDNLVETSPIRSIGMIHSPASNFEQVSLNLNLPIDSETDTLNLFSISNLNDQRENVMEAMERVMASSESDKSELLNFDSETSNNYIDEIMLKGGSIKGSRQITDYGESDDLKNISLEESSTNEFVSSSYNANKFEENFAGDDDFDNDFDNDDMDKESASQHDDDLDNDDDYQGDDMFKDLDSTDSDDMMGGNPGIPKNSVDVLSETSYMSQQMENPNAFSQTSLDSFDSE